MQNGKNITIKCIAEKMNISPSTVSRALNGKSGVSKEVREQIVALSQEMNYQTNRIAQSLRTSKSMEIGVIIPDSSNPFFSAMLTGIDSYAREMGYTLLMINSCNSPEVERKAIETFCELHVAGLLSVPTCVKHYDHLPMPVIFLTRCDNSDSNFNYIITDDVQGGYIATQNLINSSLSDFFSCAIPQISYRLPAGLRVTGPRWRKTGSRLSRTGCLTAPIPLLTATGFSRSCRRWRRAVTAFCATTTMLQSVC